MGTGNEDVDPAFDTKTSLYDEGRGRGEHDYIPHTTHTHTTYIQSFFR